MKRIVRKFIPKFVLSVWHLFWAWFGAVKYGHPSKDMIVIGITGTSGKSSTTYILRHILEHAGHTVGSLSTVDFYVAGKQKMNDKKMTMLGRMKIQQYLKEMKDTACDIAIVETTSEGYLQHRHKFIAYDMIMLTNLYPEHIDSHGSFENYKNAKLNIFKDISKIKRKKINGNIVPKASIVYGASEHADDFLDVSFETQCIFARNDEELYVESDRLKNIARMIGKDAMVDANGVHFDTEETHIDAPMYGGHSILNILAAMSVAKILEIPEKTMKEAVAKIHGVPGRLEFIPEAEKQGFKVIVDYAFEPGAMQKLFDVVNLINPKRKILVLGSTGGGRDIERRFSVGKMVAEYADVVVVTDEDPYDDDPMEIINDVAFAVEKAGKVLDQTYFKILDRGEAIQKAVNIAEKGDIVLVTGKGSEQAMVVKGRLIPWDDRKEVRKALTNKKV